VVANAWPTTPHNAICEAYAYHKELGRTFLDRLVPLLTDPIHTMEQATQLALQASPLRSTNYALLEWTLSMRAYSPVCELHRGLARDSIAGLPVKDLVAVVYPEDGSSTNNNDILSNDEEVVSIVSTSANTNSSSLLLPGEVPLGEQGDLIILYANMGTPAFAKTYTRLLESNARFVVRHLGAVRYEQDPSSASPTRLQGYGMRLDIRNVEYKVFDDRSDGETDAKATMLDLQQDVPPIESYLAGVNLTALVLEDSQLQTELWKRHDEQRKLSQIIPPVWQRQDLAVQVATVIAGSKDPLAALQEISQNLPSLASTLVHVKVPPEIRNLGGWGHVAAGGLYINGESVKCISSRCSSKGYSHTVR
jgi:hypothetical protein